MSFREHHFEWAFRWKSYNRWSYCNLYITKFGRGRERKLRYRDRKIEWKTLTESINIIYPILWSSLALYVSIISSKLWKFCDVLVAFRQFNGCYVAMCQKVNLNLCNWAIKKQFKVHACPQFLSLFTSLVLHVCIFYVFCLFLFHPYGHDLVYNVKYEDNKKENYNWESTSTSVFLDSWRWQWWWKQK